MRLLLKKLREQQDLTQEALARKLEISLHHAQALEYGNKKPSWKLVEKILSTFQIKLSDLIED